MRKILRTVAALLTLVLLSGLLRNAAADGAVSLRVEGRDGPLYYNAAFMLGASEDMRDLVETYNGLPDVPRITTAVDGQDTVITAVGGLNEKSLGPPFSDGWMIRVNGENAVGGLGAIHVKAGDDIVIYYGDPTLIQYPEIDLTRMLSHGIVRFTSCDTATDGEGKAYVTNNPVVGATVVWDDMTYLTNTAGEIIIDSTGACVRHTVSIARYYANGLPTVLRYAPKYFVRYGYLDVSVNDWFYAAVMFTVDRQLFSGVTETEFGPDAPVTRAMFVTVLGRLGEADTAEVAPVDFSDVTYDGRTTDYIMWAVESGIASGRPDGTFGPYESITREQLIVMLLRFAAWAGIDTGTHEGGLSSYSDAAAVSDYALPAMTWAIESGILTGASGLLNPGGTTTRAQAAAILERFITQYMP